jgi:Phage tail tube protein
MPRYLRNTVVLAKTEVTYGTDPVPTGAANAVLARSLTIAPLESNNVDRNLIRGYMGNMGQIPVNQRVSCQMEIEAAGAGSAGTVPAYDALLQACGLSSTNSPGVHQLYAPITTAFKAATIYYHADGVLHKLLGCRGNPTLRFTTGEIPVYVFSFQAKYGGVTAIANATPTLTAWQKPEPVNDTNTTDISLHATSYPFRSFELDLGNQVTFQDLVGSETVEITDRKPVGRVVLDVTAAQQVAFQGSIAAVTTGALTHIHGSAAGKIIEVAAPVVQLLNPRYEDFNGQTLFGMDLSFIPSAGNDEVTIKVR